MNVLIACEESQTSCIEFRKLGHNAFSCLWTKGLPRLIPTDVLSDYVSYIAVCGSSQKVRSKSFHGISKAFATQYSAAILSGVNYSLPVQLSLFDWS